MQKKYKVEFAVSAKSEMSAFKILADAVGVDLSTEVPLSKIDKRAGLFIIEHAFLKDQLSDAVYEKIIKSKHIFIVRDDLSLARAAMLSRRCAPVEIQLKKLLIYVMPEISKAFDADFTAKDKIEQCRNINRYTFGQLLQVLDIDIMSKTRKALLENDASEFFKIINEANTFEDFKVKLGGFVQTKRVWDVINEILEAPLEYKIAQGMLGQVRDFRNRAAHLQVIFQKDIIQADRCTKKLLGYLGSVKSDYKNMINVSLLELSKGLAKLTKTMRAKLTPFGEEELEKMFQAKMEPLRGIAEKLSVALQPSKMAFGVPQVDWAKMLDNMRQVPDMRDIIETVENDGMDRFLDDFSNEVKNAA